MWGLKGMVVASFFPDSFYIMGAAVAAAELDQKQKLLWPLLLTRFNFNPSMDK